MCAVIKNDCLFFCGVLLWAGPIPVYCPEELRFHKDFAAMMWVDNTWNELCHCKYLILYIDFTRVH